MNSDERWDQHFFLDAIWTSRKSKDRSTKHGCVVVNDRRVDLARGWNGFPRGVNDDVEERHERPEKYLWVQHAERNCISNSSAEGIALRGCTMYVTALPCCDCAKSIIQAGIKRVCTIEPDWSNKHVMDTQRLDVSMTLFQESGVKVDFIVPQDAEHTLTPGGSALQYPFQMNVAMKKTVGK